MSGRGPDASHAIVVHEEVADALTDGRPVVALETAVVTAGLPAEPMGRVPRCQPRGWRPDRPINIELARACERIIREAGAVPATVGVLDGRLRVGLDEEDLQRLASKAPGGKASTADLGMQLARGTSAGTTVAATLAACRLAKPRPIRVMATGGIGGVHRAWTRPGGPDVSADLRELARSPVAVVCSGVKAILDVSATLEVLQTLAVPTLAWRTDRFPQFYSPGVADLPASQRTDDLNEVASLCRLHWWTLGRHEAVLLACPVPEEYALNAEQLNAVVARADEAATAAGVRGPSRTPHLLDAVAEATGGDALQANLALLVNNAAIAADLAVRLAHQPPRWID